MLVTPTIVAVALKHKLFDDPLELRRIHTKIVPTVGGIMIFLGVLSSCSLFVSIGSIPHVEILFLSGFIMFMIGLKDDLQALVPLQKFIAQIAAAMVVVVFADIRISSLYGFLGVHHLPYGIGVLLSVFYFVMVINAFNLVDGIDGLAGALGLLIGLFYAVLFHLIAEPGYAGLSLAITGALAGFLHFNFTPAKIFMGDSGSLLLGFMIAFISIRMLNADAIGRFAKLPMHLTSILALVTATVSVPVFDAIRVFLIRIWRGGSPFLPDKHHTHHRLLSLGLGHSVVTCILVGTNLLLVLFSLTLQRLGDTTIVFAMLIIMLVLNITLSSLVKSCRKRWIPDSLQLYFRTLYKKR